MATANTINVGSGTSVIQFTVNSEPSNANIIINEDKITVEIDIIGKNRIRNLIRFLGNYLHVDHSKS